VLCIHITKSKIHIHALKSLYSTYKTTWGDVYVTTAALERNLQYLQLVCHTCYIRCYSVTVTNEENELTVTLLNQT